MTDHDSPWKQVCDHFFPEMLDLVMHEAYADIDWTQPFRILDKELPKVAPEHEAGCLYADKLIEVCSKSGAPEIVFIHIEFQNQVDRKFSKRMYRYNYRIEDKFQHPVVSLAILGDRSRTWRPGPYRFKKWGFDLSMAFPVVKLIDYEARVDELAASNNPFAAVILAFLAGHATHNNPQERLTVKYGLVKRLYQKQFSRETILNLFQFIDWTLTLPPDLAQQFLDDLAVLEGESNMPYITSVERMAIERGRAEGLAEGLAERQKVQAENQKLQTERIEAAEATKRFLVENLTNLLAYRFGPLSDEVQTRIDQADSKTIQIWTSQAWAVADLPALFGES